MTTKPHIRTCIACGRKAQKHELVRVVRLNAGEVELDASLKKDGRGAYVCKKHECFGYACEKGMFGRRLRTKICAKDLQQLKIDFSALLGL